MKKRGKVPHSQQRRNTDESFAFRQRMATAEAKEKYKQRPSIAEYVNKEFRKRRLTQFRVRGLEKTLAVALLYALACNVLRMIAFGVFA